ncbi:MAG: N,N-dimethylformamidase beta subunit family domain-containing protein, partial [Pseudomonadota bacterium]
MQKLPDITVNAAPKSTNLPEPVRQLPVPGLWGYLSQWSTAPGGSVGVHVSAEADHEVELLRLGTCALLDPASSLDDDRAEATVLQRWSRPAAPQTIAPGSYVLCGGPPVDTDGLSAGLWLRLWALPKIDVVQVAYAGIIGDIDYPDCARFGLLLDHVGQIGVYCGDGGPFRYSALHRTAPVLADRLGSWCHVAATVSHEGCVVYVDGAQVARFDGASLPPQPAGSRFRIGAMAEGSAAANFLDGDIAQSFLGSPITASAARSLYDAQGARPVSEILGEALHAEWPLDEEDGVDVADRSGNARHGTIVNHGCWMVGGPAFDAKGCRPDNHDPSRAPHRGHGLRLCSDSLMDARWPVAIEAPIAAEAPSGVYGIRVRLVGQDDAAALTMPLVVSRRTPPTEDCLAIIAATNTWHAYGRRPTNELAVHGLTSSLYSTHRNGRPFFHLGLRLPLPHADPFRYETARAAQTRSTHLVRTERHLEAWLRREGYRFEMVSDLDLHVEPELLERFRAVAVVGHNEYWSDEARDGLERYL